MPMPERYHPECPPDAHKVIRPPETEVKAQLCVKIPDSELDNGIDNVCDLLYLMSKTPLAACSEQVRAAIMQAIPDGAAQPGFLKTHDDQKASIIYADGAVGPVTDYFDFSGNSEAAKDFLGWLEQKCIICIDMQSMFILRSISTIYPWDKLLAKQFLGQYLEALSALDNEDKKLLSDVRYGRFDSLKVNEKSPRAYKFLRVERKLFLQYPTED